MSSGADEAAREKCRGTGELIVNYFLRHSLCSNHYPKQHVLFANLERLSSFNLNAFTNTSAIA